MTHPSHNTSHLFPSRLMARVHERMRLVETHVLAGSLAVDTFHQAQREHESEMSSGRKKDKLEILAPRPYERHVSDPTFLCPGFIPPSRYGLFCCFCCCFVAQVAHKQQNTQWKILLLFVVALCRCLCCYYFCFSWCCCRCCFRCSFLMTFLGVFLCCCCLLFFIVCSAFSVVCVVCWCFSVLFLLLFRLLLWLLLLLHRPLNFHLDSPLFVVVCCCVSSCFVVVSAVLGPLR